MKKPIKIGVGWACLFDNKIQTWTVSTYDRWFKKIKNIKVAIVPYAQYRKMVKELKELNK